MNLSQHTAKHLRTIHFGGNWTTTNLKDVLSDVSWEEALTPVRDFNTIATLTYHMTYYVTVLLEVFEGKPLTAKDELSFQHPSIQSQEAWKAILDKAWTTAENAAHHLEQLPEETLLSDFSDPKYGTYYTNIHGIIEHMHYHLGQIVVLKRLIRAGKT